MATGISALSTAVAGCGVVEVESKLDALAAAVKWANITKLDKFINGAVKIVVGAADLDKDLKALGKAVRSGDPTQIGDALGSLLDKWTAVTGGCKSNKACSFVDGILRIVETVASDYSACHAAVEPAYAQFQAGVAAMHGKNVSGAVQGFAQGLDTLAQALTDDSCGLQKLAAVIEKVAPKLAAAVVKDDQVIVGYANVYDEIFAAVVSVEDGDVVAFGMSVGRMLQSLRASDCKTKFCVVLQGILGTLQLEVGDFAECAADADLALHDVEAAVRAFETTRWAEGAKDLAAAIKGTAKAVSDCGVQQLAEILEDTATQLGASSLATEIGDIASLLVSGADVTDLLSKTVADLNNNNYNALGMDLQSLSTKLSGSKCNSIVCKVVEGLLNAAGVAYTDLQGCEADLRDAETNFITGSQDFKQKAVGKGLNQWATGLNAVAKAVTDCDLQHELGFIAQEANVLGLGNASIVGEIGSIMVHGADVYEHFFTALQNMEQHDWRDAGQDFGIVLAQLSKWTDNHACKSDVCFVVVGMFQFMGSMKGSIKTCQNDFMEARGDFEDGWSAFDDRQSTFHFSHNADKVKEGAKAFGKGLKKIADAASDCHLEEFAELLTNLAIKLGIVPALGWIEELLHILIEGVHIEREIGDACEDYADGNWAGFGYNLAKLTKTLLQGGAQLETVMHDVRMNYTYALQR